MIYKEGETYFHNQMLGAPCGISMPNEQQADAAMPNEAEEVIEYRCKSCECELYEGCQQCLYCNLMNPLEAVQQVEGIQQVATLAEIKETIQEFKDGGY